ETFCGGRCTAGQGVCPAVPWVAEGPHLKHEFVHVWRRRTTQVLNDCEAIVVANPVTRELFQAMMPAIGRLRWEVIEHGRDLERHAVRTPADDGKLRLLLAGHVRVAKGSHFVQALRAADVGGRLEFHVLGSVWPDETGIIDHGGYDRHEFAERVSEIDPHALLLPSMTAETYSHVVTEGWAAGLPVIATDRGAPAERIRRTGAGWLIDADDPGVALRQIEAGFETERIAEVRQRVSEVSWPTTTEMADRYADLYDELIEARLTVRSGS
ncbi:MAG: glycosyltransferase, partial [Acidimicrobiia bacterium]|nr:glycosyltransferase [Acidimicrobiia bacterium]